MNKILRPISQTKDQISYSAINEPNFYSKS
jgi:hypothetical protein